MNGNRILVSRSEFSDENFSEIEYAVFNSDGTRITTFGNPDTGVCKFQLNSIRNITLLPTGKVVITGESDSETVVYHVGESCSPVAVE